MKTFTGMTLRFDLLTPPAAAGRTAAETPGLVEEAPTRPPLGRLGWAIAILLGVQLALRLAFGYVGSAYFPPGRVQPMDWTEAEKLLVGMVNLHGMADLWLSVGLLAALGFLVSRRRTPVILLGVLTVLSVAHSLAGWYLARTWVPEHLAAMTAEQVARLPSTVQGSLAWMGFVGVVLASATIALVAIQRGRRI